LKGVDLRGAPLGGASWDEHSVNTLSQQRGLIAWQKGQSCNPKGRYQPAIVINDQSIVAQAQSATVIPLYYQLDGTAGRAAERRDEDAPGFATFYYFCNRLSQCSQCRLPCKPRARVLRRKSWGEGICSTCRAQPEVPAGRESPSRRGTIVPRGRGTSPWVGMGCRARRA
jgi:hypothetical protein